MRDEPVPAIACPICGATRASTRTHRKSPRATLRNMLQNHIYNKHPGLGSRERSLVLERALEDAARWGAEEVIWPTVA